MSYPQLCNIPYQNQPDLLRKIKYKTAKLFFFPQSFDKENIPISLYLDIFKRLHYGEKERKEREKGRQKNE